MLLNRDDCKVLRGLAILGIFIHNFCHMLKGAAQENEFFFSMENDVYFWEHAFSEDFSVHLFSYLGHLGVPVFVFLTGYGLSVKYGREDSKKIETKMFLIAHFRKLFSPMLFGLFLFYGVFLLINSSLWEGWIISLITQVTMTGNFMLHPNLIIKPGPYWYFGLTMQLYLFYRLIIYNHLNRFFVIILTMSLVALLLLKSHFYLLVWFKYNAIGWLLPFTIGILFGAYNGTFNNWGRAMWCVVSFVFGVVILWAGRNYYSWLLIPVMTIPFFIGICKLLTGYVYVACIFLGNLSLYIFVLHPIAREIVFTLLANNILFVNLFIYITAVILGSLLFSWLDKQLNHVIY